MTGRGRSEAVSSDGPLLQLAVDVLTTSDALEIMEEVYPFFDIVEVGTPLVIEEGLSALEAMKEKRPEKQYLADLKIMDAGQMEASSGFRRGADIVTVLAAADDQTIGQALRAAREYDGRIMVDLINEDDPVARARQLEEMGVDILCVHTAFDRQSSEVGPMAELERVRAAVSCRLAVAGGLDGQTTATALALGADIVIVGGAVLKAQDRREAARVVYETVHKERL